MSFSLDYSQTETDNLIARLEAQWAKTDPDFPPPPFANTFKVYKATHALPRYDGELIALVSNCFYAKASSIKEWDGVLTGSHIAHNPCGPAVLFPAGYYKRFILNGINCPSPDAYLDMMFGPGNQNIELKAEFKLALL